MNPSHNNKVLIIEDDRQSQVLISQLLKKCGYEIAGTAGTGMDGLNLFQAHQVDVILLDIGLPDISGIELLKKFQKIRPVPVVVLSADEKTETVLAASEAGAVFYLVKPPDLRQLDRAIIVAVTGFNHKRELIRLNEQLANEISRRSTAEQIAMAGEIRYRELFELLRDGVVLLDLRGKLVQYNGAFLKMVGYFSSELEMVSFDEIIFQEDIVLYRKMYQDQVLGRGWSDTFEIRFRCKAGNILTIEMRAWLRYDTPQNPSGIWVYLHDITERKKSELLLRDSERKFRAFTENTPDVIIRFDNYGKILYVNPAFEKVTGIRNEFAIGKRVCELENIELDFNLDSLVTLEKIKSGGIVQTDIFLKSSAGKFVFNCRVLAEFDDNGEFKSVLSTSRDISELKQIQQNLLQFEKMRAVDQLAGGIAHDFNNQLGAIMGYSDMLLDAVSHDQKLTRYTEAIVSATRRATDLTAKLLTFSRKSKIKTVAIDLHDIIREVVILLQHSVDKNISLETDLQAENSCISGDPSQVQNALLNLALNARDAMPDGGRLMFETVEITIEKDHSICNVFEVNPGLFINVRVRDSGCGMDADVLKHLFEPFFTTKLPGKGTGLGLAAVYGTIKSHHGGIIVNSTPGKGTVFDLLFPLESTVLKRSIHKANNIELSRVNASILIVDDEDLVREMANESLTNAGYSITASRNGDDALAVYKEKFSSIDLVIIDLILPGLSGLELLSELKKINNSIKVMVFSGSISQTDTTSFPEGVVAVLQKPFRVADLISKVTEVLQAG